GTSSPFLNNPVLPAAVAQSATGQYAATGITLYKSGSNTLTFTACGLAGLNQTVTVNPAAQNSVRLSTTNDEASPPAHSSEVYCPFAAASTTNNVQCNTLYAYNLDQYGNATAGTNACSSWSWSGQTGSAAPSVPGTAGRTASLSTTNAFLDGTLTCNTSAGLTAQTILYGGIKSLELGTYTGSPGPVSLTAGSSNFSFSTLKINTQKQNDTIALPAAGDGAQSVSFNASAGLTLSDITALSTPQNCTFTSGACTLPWSSLSFQKTLSNKTLTLSVRGVSVTTGNISVSPAAAHHLTVVSPAAASSVTAGTAFNASIEVRDQFENVVPTAGCTSLTPSVSAGNSPNGTAPTLNSASSHASGVYSLSNLVLVKKNASETLSFTPAGCALSAATVGLQVNENTLNSVRISTTNNDSSPPAHMTELNCLLSNASPSDSNAVACGTLYAYSLDTYGNAVGSSSSPCDSWSYVANTGGGSLSPSLTNTAKSHTLTHTDFFDGQLTCTKSGTTAVVNVYGGVSRIDIPSADRTSTDTAAVANNNNFSVSRIKAYSRKGGADVVFPDGSQQVSVSTTY
ncbi:hypothetical protein EBR21_14620, partial [bacterium]|nr:hypothetical protein [bacterium]